LDLAASLLGQAPPFYPAGQHAIAPVITYKHHIEDRIPSMANCQIGLNAVVLEVLIPLPGCAIFSSCSFFRK
jgi:hypothetical protein